MPGCAAGVVGLGGGERVPAQRRLARGLLVRGAGSRTERVRRLARGPQLDTHNM